jgi:exodeoxyribonuclease VII large subunit
MIHIIKQKVQLAKIELSKFQMKERAPDLVRINEATQSLDELFLKMNHGFAMKMNHLNEQVKGFHQVLNALNPKLVLKRGYSFVKVSQQNVISSSSQFKELPHGSKLEIHFFDGQNIVTKD